MQILRLEIFHYANGDDCVERVTAAKYRDNKIDTFISILETVKTTD